MRRATLAAALLAAGAAWAQAPDGVERWIAQRYGPDVVAGGWFQGATAPDGAAAGLSVVYYPFPGGNAMQIGVDAFRVTAAGTEHVGPIDGLFGSDPRDAEFGDGVVALTTTMPRPGDPRCCPTGATRWTIDLKALKVIAETPSP